MKIRQNDQCNGGNLVTHDNQHKIEHIQLFCGMHASISPKMTIFINLSKIDPYYVIKIVSTLEYMI